MAVVPEEIPSISADEATKEFFGYLVEVDCGEEGCYSGCVSEVEPADNNLCTWGKIKLESPSRNGVPLGEQLAIIVPGQLIVNIKIIKMPSQTLKNKQQEITNTNTKNYTNNKIFERKGKEQQSNNIRQRIQSSSAAGDLRSIQYPKSTYQGIQNKQQQEKTVNKFNQIFRQRIRSNVENVGNITSSHCPPISTYQAPQNKKQEKTTNKNNNNKAIKLVENKSKEQSKQQNRQKSSNVYPNVGNLVSIQSSGGTYQGIVSAINDKLQTIRLEKPLLDGHPLVSSFIDLHRTIMKGVKIYSDDRTGHNRHLSRELRRPKVFEGVYMQSLPVSSVQQKQQQSERRSDISKIKADSKVETRSPTQLAHEEYGEYKKFTEPQIPYPVKLQPNPTPKRNLNNSNSGPTGIPTIDCINGYRGYCDRNNFEDTMGDALDYETLNTDFDFAGNLALFDKKAFTNQVDHIALGLNSIGTNSRNYNHDENILMDSSRVISWTTKTFVPSSSSSAVKNSTGTKVAHSFKSFPHHNRH
ncbi:FDF domain-containing protein [Meloidogyne graminicola]|uniref:FDF domain-containing protein n=1 Tax=Meloidogyne graminicola TaxID=189291 RepID=A0A8S9ZN15_9BILA|nr:FDF domain-containing protein [Meloidogyne graminicola]